MIRDGELILCDAQSLANAVGTFLSEASFDSGTVDSMVAAFQSRGAVPHDVGKGRPVFIICKIDSDVTDAGGTSTLKVELIEADDEALTSNVRSISISGAAIAKASLVSGYPFSVPFILPPDPATPKRYYGLRFTVAGEAITGGTVSAWLSPHPMPLMP
jgi:hypothetical protein